MITHNWRPASKHYSPFLFSPHTEASITRPRKHIYYPAFLIFDVTRNTKQNSRFAKLPFPSSPLSRQIQKTQVLLHRGDSEVSSYTWPKHTLVQNLTFKYVERYLYLKALKTLALIISQTTLQYSLMPGCFEKNLKQVSSSQLKGYCLLSSFFEAL